MSPFHRVSIVAFALSFLFSSRALAEEPVAPKPMTNEDVVLLTKLGLGDDLVIAKIQAAPAADFKTDLPDLEILKNEGVSPGVITAMVKRQAAASSSPGAATDASADIAVTLWTKDKGEIPLSPIAGTVSSTYAFVTVLVHTNFPGLRSEVRTVDRRPTMTVKSAKSPTGRVYLVVAEVDRGDNERSVKVGNMGVFKAKGLNAPDKSNRVECDVTPEGTGVWRLTPKNDLKPGEYGIWSVGQTVGNAGGGELFDFGID